MKIKLALFGSIILLGMGACTKDRVCQCNSTYTSSSGNVTTVIDDNVTFVNSTRAQAVSHCQKSTVTTVGTNGSTTTRVMDCKLK